MSAPTRLGKYEVRRELGKGSMGVVYEAFDPFIERRVAIKVIRQDELGQGQTRDLLARLRREAQAAGRLNHPGIVAIYDYGEEDATLGGSGLAYIAMELIDGRELKDYFDADHQFPPQDVVRIMEEVLAALQHAHERGVTHRDIKPSNVILLRNGRVKVADFGVARLDTSELTQAGMMIGTPMYMSPEQILGLPVDGRADLFSCGVMLYQFLTGEKPFTGSIATVMQKVLHHHPPPVTQLNSTLAPAWDDVLRTALGKKPEERYPSAAAMAEAIRRASLEPSPGQKDQVTVLLPRPAAGVTLPPLPGAMGTRPMPAAAAPRAAPAGAAGARSAAAAPVAAAATPAANPAAAPLAGKPGAQATPGAKPAASPAWAAPGASSATPAAGRPSPFLNAQATSTSALATVVANALSGPSATIKPTPAPPPPPAVVPRLGMGPRAIALAAVLGGAAVAAYLAWPSGKPSADGAGVLRKPAASQAPAASRPVPVALPADLPASQATFGPAGSPSSAPVSIARAGPAAAPANDRPAAQAPAPASKPVVASTSRPVLAPSPPPASAAPSPAPPAAAAAPATGPAAVNPEWSTRLARLEALRGPQTLAGALATLLEPFSAEERALAADFEAQFRQRPQASALVVGVVDGHFRSNWQTKSPSAERAMEQARKRCREQSVAGCSVVMVNGEFQREGLLAAARELGAQPPSVVRARVLRGFERTLAEWRQADSAARPPSASPAYPAPAPPAVAAAPAATPPAAARSAEVVAAETARAEWSQAVAQLRSEAPSSISRGLELLLRASGDDSARLSRLQWALKRMRWNSAVAMGEKDGYLVFAWSHSERRPDWAQERALADCNRAAAAPCAVVMADGSYANAALVSIGSRLGSHSQQSVRENFMRHVQRKLQDGMG